MNFTREINASAAQHHDQGLRNYMLGVYRHMCIALLITATVSYMASTSGGLMRIIHTGGLHLVIAFAPIALAMFISYRINNISIQAAQYLFLSFAVLMGLSLSIIFVVYSSISITKIFFMTSATFGSMALYGYTTKKCLEGMGAFCFMGLIGIIIASLVNLLFHSSALEFAIAAIGVFVFAVLTAYDTQRIKSMYYKLGGNQEMAQKISVIGALNLYLDFINIFISLLTLFGNRK